MNLYQLKRETLNATGVLSYRWNRLIPGIYVFNYHRIGDPRETPFDPNLFSSDEAHFADQIALIKSHFQIIDIPYLLKIIAREKPVNHPMAMITFDDGYRDNYEKAFPILREQEIPAVFFLPTSYIDSNKIPWWDEIAWMIKNTKRNTVKIAGWESEIPILENDMTGSIRRVLSKIKKTTDIPMQQKINLLQQELDCQLKSYEDDSLFMTWKDASVLAKHGMNIGSHTHSHQILSHLNTDEQCEELGVSKRLIENNTETSADALAYPVGGRNSYTKETCNLARKSGYKVAFTFVSGFNPSPQDAAFELLRIPVEKNFQPADIKYLAITAKH